VVLERGVETVENFFLQFYIFDNKYFIDFFFLIITPNFCSKTVETSLKIVDKKFSRTYHSDTNS